MLPTSMAVLCGVGQRHQVLIIVDVLDGGENYAMCQGGMQPLMCKVALDCALGFNRWKECWVPLNAVTEFGPIPPCQMLIKVALPTCLCDFSISCGGIEEGYGLKKG